MSSDILYQIYHEHDHLDNKCLSLSEKVRTPQLCRPWESPKKTTTNSSIPQRYPNNVTGPALDPSFTVLLDKWMIERPYTTENDIRHFAQLGKVSCQQVEEYMRKKCVDVEIQTNLMRQAKCSRAHTKDTSQRHHPYSAKHRKHAKKVCTEPMKPSVGGNYFIPYHMRHEL
jgi:hypothetical protein